MHASLDILTHPSCSLSVSTSSCTPSPNGPQTPTPTPQHTPHGPSKLVSGFRGPRPRCQSAAPCQDPSSDRPVPSARRSPHHPTRPLLRKAAGMLCSPPLQACLQHLVRARQHPALHLSLTFKHYPRGLLTRRMLLRNPLGSHCHPFSGAPNPDSSQGPPPCPAPHWLAQGNEHFRGAIGWRSCLSFRRRRPSQVPPF